MESNVADILHCEKQLRTTLHSDDKEKLRRKLALLQREYLRTAQRLQRAERSEAVRRHVRSRITQQNHQDQRDPEITSNPCPKSTTNGTASGIPQCQGDTGDPTDSENTRRPQVVKFSLPSDGHCPQATDPCYDATRGHRPSPALRLRSRRSRLRWERRSSEAGMSTDNTDEGWEQSERMETDSKQGSEGRVKHEGTEVVNESEELFSGTESESASLLLTHWNTCGQTKTGDMEGKEIQGGQEQSKKETELRSERKKEAESASLLLTCGNPAIKTEGRGRDGTRNRRREEREGGEEGETSRQRDGMLCEDSRNKNTDAQNATKQIESKISHDNAVEIIEEKSGLDAVENDVKGAGLLESCTLVEGLLFPAEYYIRTTRRMTSSQSQPDMQAVILSQLSSGRHRRSRGRGRGLNRLTQSPSVGPHMESEAADTSAELNNQSSSQISDQIAACQIEMDACFSPTITTTRPSRGKRRRRGRGRGRPQTPQGSLDLDTHQPGLGQTSDDLQPTSSSVSSSSSLHETHGPKSCLTPGEAVPDDAQPASTHSTPTQPSSGGNAAQSSSASGHLVYPIFQKSCDRTNRSTQMSTSADTCQSLLLPSSPPAQTSLLPLSSLSLGPLVKNLMNFDIPQDFHLPDDQFASLKLHKLHQVALESGVELFASPSFNTRRSIRRYGTCHNSFDPVMSLPLPLSLTPTISSSANHIEAKQGASQPTAGPENVTIKHKLTGKSTSQSLTEESPTGENPGKQQADDLHPEGQTSTESVSLPHDCDQYKEKNTVILNSHSQINVSSNNKHRSIEQSFKSQPHINFADRPDGKKSDFVMSQSEEPTGCPGLVDPLEDQRSTKHQTEDKAIMKTLSYDCLLLKSPEEPFNTCTAVQAGDDSEGPGESPVQHLNMNSPAEESKEPSEATTSPPKEKSLPLHSVHSQFLLSPPLASAPFISPHLCSSALPSNPTLPTLGLTPHPVSAAAPLLTSSPSAPALILPSPHSPSTQDLSPPILSPCPSLTSLPCSQPPTSPTGQIQASFEPPQRVEPATCPAISRIQSQCSGWPVGQDGHTMRGTATLKAPAGGCLVDACCLPGSSGGLYVAAAGKWTVCLWSQTSASDWSLIHTWTFNEPVISVFPVPDAAGLMCVTLGQLEIREVRMLSCSSLFQVLFYEGLVQAVVGVPKSRVVTSSHSASGSTLQVFTVLDSGSTLSSQPLSSPGVCVGALAPVDGLPDAVIGTDEDGCLFVWNLRTGQLLQRIMFADGLSHMACLRGYSYCGVLFVLLQHQLLCSLGEEENQATKKDLFLEEDKSAERETTALLSLIAINPLNGKSIPATRLHPPKSWSGRLCKADVNSCSVVGLSHSGHVCVWELGSQEASRMVRDPESEGWQLARWGGRDTLLTGHHNGDVTLHCYSSSVTSA